MLIKSVDVQYKDEGTGTIEGYASTWVRKPDSYGDVVRKGAFTDTLADAVRLAARLHIQQEPVPSMG